MAEQGGVVWHPELDAEIRAVPAGRIYLVRHLKAEADTANAAGDANTKLANYDKADQMWRVAARCMRASQAVGGGKSVNPEDYPIVAAAWRRAQTEITREKVAKK